MIDLPEPAAIRTRDPERRRAERAMGTVVSLFCPEGGAASHAADAAFAWFHDVHRRFSPFNPGSEVGRLIRGEVTLGGVSGDLAEVLEIAAAVELLSGGAFDIRGHRADGAPDPTAIVKGWSVDRAALILAAGGIERFSLNAGGDVVVRGGQERGLPWRIGVANPFASDTLTMILEAEDLAVATSGTTERGLHIVDARTGRAAQELSAITVVGPSLARADGYATAACAMGREGLRWVAALPGYDAAGITQDGRLLSTRGLGRYRAGGSDGSTDAASIRRPTRGAAQAAWPSTPRRPATSGAPCGTCATSSTSAASATPFHWTADRSVGQRVDPAVGRTS